MRNALIPAVFLLCASVLMVGQEAPAYQPKYPGDPAHSEAEAIAVGYMRVVVNAQKNYKHAHNEYSPSLAGLVGKGSFTRRMLKADRGDYTVHFKGTADSYSLSMVPKNFDPQHRSFFTDETGKIRVDESKEATADSDVAR